MLIEFTIPGEPQGKARPRFARVGGFTKVYTPKETANYENLVKLCYQQAAQGIKLSGAIEATIKGIFPIPKSVSKKNRKLMLEQKIFHTKKIDCDNLAKIVLDALNGIAYDDDKQVFRLRVEKFYGEPTRTEVHLKEIEQGEIKE